MCIVSMPRKTKIKPMSSAKNIRVINIFSYASASVLVLSLLLGPGHSFATAANYAPADDWAAVFVPGITFGSLFKAPGSSVIYLYGEDGRRHVFPTEAIYRTWYRDFGAVRLLPTQIVGSIPLGDNMTVRPGSALLKLTSDPRVYAVDTDGGLHWITTEEIARVTYGPHWTDRVLDLSDALFPDYVQGEPITSLELASKFPMF